MDGTRDIQHYEQHLGTQKNLSYLKHYPCCPDTGMDKGILQYTPRNEHELKVVIIIK